MPNLLPLCSLRPLRRLCTLCMRSLLLLTLSVLAAAPAKASEPALRVAIVENSPPHSYIDANGKPAGFIIALADALCDAMQMNCNFHVLRIGEVIDALAEDKVDFAAVTLLATPERQARVIFSKPFFRSVSTWLAKPAMPPGSPGLTVAVVRGSAQSRYIETQGWKSLPVNTHMDVLKALTSGTANAALVPMLTAITLTSNQKIQALGMQSTFMSDPLLSGDVCLSINPQRPELKERIDEAIDTVKRDGRFDRINTQFLPFRLQ